MQPPLRIAILECDTPLEKTRSKYGGYGGVFEALFAAGADALDMPEVISSKKGLEITFWDVVSAQAYPDLDSIDAIMVTGSRFDSFADDDWILKLVEFTRGAVAHNHVRVMGVCFGHQIVGRAMDVKVGRNPGGWEISVSLVKMSEKGKELFGKDFLSLQQMHRDAVYVCPAGVEELGSSPACEVQGMYSKGHVMTVQGHPEFNKSIVTELLESRHEMKIFDDEMFKDGMSRVGNQQDGVLVAQGFLKFLLDD